MMMSVSAEVDELDHDADELDLDADEHDQDVDDTHVHCRHVDSLIRQSRAHSMVNLKTF